jgi:isopentenyldiphosphate isomerase
VDPNDPREAFDVLTDTGNPTGRVKAREDVHRDGNWHGAVHVWLHDGSGRVLLQRRSQAKDLSPGKVDVAVGGHMAAGETAWDALREVKEELGFDLGVSNVTHLGRFASVRTYQDATDREYQDVFLSELPVPIEALAFDTREVVSVQWVGLADFTALLTDGRPVAADAFGAGGQVSRVILTAEDVIVEGREATLRELQAVAAQLVTVGPHKH